MMCRIPGTPSSALRSTKSRSRHGSERVARRFSTGSRFSRCVKSSKKPICASGRRRKYWSGCPIPSSPNARDTSLSVLSVSPAQLRISFTPRVSSAGTQPVSGEQVVDRDRLRGEKNQQPFALRLHLQLLSERPFRVEERLLHDAVPQTLNLIRHPDFLGVEEQRPVADQATVAPTSTTAWICCLSRPRGRRQRAGAFALVRRAG